MATETPTFLLAMGRMTVRFAALELKLNLLAWLLIDSRHPDVPACVTVNLGFQSLLQLVSSLHRAHGDDETISKELNSLLKRASEAATKRNKLTHSYYGSANEGIIQFEPQFKFKKDSNKLDKLKWDLQETDASQVEEVACEIGNVAADLDRFILAHRKRFQHLK